MLDSGRVEVDTRVCEKDVRGVWQGGEEGGEVLWSGEKMCCVWKGCVLESEEGL